MPNAARWEGGVRSQVWLVWWLTPAVQPEKGPEAVARLATISGYSGTSRLAQALPAGSLAVHARGSPLSLPGRMRVTE